MFGSIVDTRILNSMSNVECYSICVYTMSFSGDGSVDVVVGFAIMIIVKDRGFGFSTVSRVLSFLIFKRTMRIESIVIKKWRD